MNKLADILFLPEAARTAAEALDKGIAAKELKADYLTSRNMIVLYSARRMHQAINRKLEGQELLKFAAKNAIVAVITYTTLSVAGNADLRKISTSSGVNKFGPLAYQIAMARIYPVWLKSDMSLSNLSHAVWNKMYELSENGVYERRWLGDFNGGNNLLYDAMMVNNKTANAFYEQLKDKGIDYPWDEPEDVAVSIMADNGLEPSEYGQLWAYRRQDPSPEIQALFDRDVEITNLLETELGYQDYHITGLWQDAGRAFFRRMYNAPRVVAHE